MQYLAVKQRRIQKATANGFCFINATTTCLKVDHNLEISVDDCINEILKELLNHHSDYVDFMTSKKHCDKRVTDADILLGKFLDFFKSRNYQASIVDLLIQVTANALNVNIYIYQKHGTYIQIVPVKSQNKRQKSARSIHLKFTHDNKNTAGNHYDAIVKKDGWILDDGVGPTPEASPEPTTSQAQPSSSLPKSTNTQAIHVNVNGNFRNIQHINARKTHMAADRKNEQTINGAAKHLQNKQVIEEPIQTAPLDLSQSTWASNKPATSTSVGDDTDPLLISDDDDEWTPPETQDPRLRRFPGFQLDHDKSDAELVDEVGRGKSFPTDIFKDTPVEEVDSIPPLIDGRKVYKVKTSLKNLHDTTNDLRNFEMSTSGKKGRPYHRRQGRCHGAHVCINPACPFLETSHNRQPNRVNFTTVMGATREKICKICGHFGEREGCSARKLVEYDQLSETAMVYHLGKHTCFNKLNKKKQREGIEGRTSRRYSGPAKEVAVNEIIHILDVEDADLAAATAGNWTDRRYAARVMAEENTTYGDDMNSFDAVSYVKRKTDERDPYLIHVVNNGAANTKHGKTDYIMKASKAMLKYLLKMDIDRDPSIWQEENAYMDCTFNRVHGFASFALWVCHPIMGKILCIANMDMRSENYVDIAKFLTHINEMLAEISGIPGYMFNPRAFVCDEGGAIWKAIRHVYGEEFVEERVFGCQFHFKNNIIRRSKDVAPEMRELFIKTCQELCDVTTVADYNTLKERLDGIAELFPDLKSWIEWWHVRRSHIFHPFRGSGLPGVNYSEMGNKGWKTRTTMRLVHAAKYDVATMLLQEREVELFSKNQIQTTGQGPTPAARKQRETNAQMKVAEDFVNILDDPEAVFQEAEQAINPTKYIPGGNHRHKPPEENAPPPKKRGRPPKGTKTPLRQKNILVEEAKMRKNIQLGYEISGVTREDLMSVQQRHATRKEKLRKPLVIFTDGRGIHVCQGCPNPISKQEQKYPKNMVFRMKIDNTFLHKTTNRVMKKEQDAHFHLNMTCLRKKDASVEMRDIYMTDDTFQELTRENMEVQQKANILQHILAHKV